MNAEIYLRLPDDVELLKWVDTRFDHRVLVKEMEDICIYHASFRGAHVALTITPRIEGGEFTSCLLYTSPSPRD